MVEFEELKRRIMLRIDGEEEIPEEVTNIVMKVFEQIEEIYNENRCNNSSISERIYAESVVMKRMLNEKITDSMKNEKFQRAMAVMDRMERYQEDIQQEKHQMSEEEWKDIEKRMDTETRDGLSEIGGDNQQFVSTIMREMEDVLQDIRLTQNRILYNRGEFNPDKIYDIQQQVLYAIRQFQNQEQEILQLLQQKDKRLREDIFEQYEEYIQDREQAQKEKSESETFRDSLNAGISLEEQFHSAKMFMDEQKQQDEQKNGKSKQLVDELPELFL